MLARLKKKKLKTSLKIFALRTGENNMTYLEKDLIEILELKELKTNTTMDVFKKQTTP